MATLKSATRRARKSAKSATGQQELKPVATSSQVQQADTAALAQMLGVSPDQLSKIQAALGIAGGALPAASTPSEPDNSPVVRVENYTNKRGNSFPSIQIWYEGVKLTKDGREYKADFFIGGKQFRKLLAILDDKADMILEELDKLESGNQSKSSK